MSEAQKIIEKNFEQICKDVNIETDGEFGRIEKIRLYNAIRSFVYEWLCDFSTLKDAGLPIEELEQMQKEYKPNKYESSL